MLKDTLGILEIPCKYSLNPERRKKVAEDIFETITTENFPQIHISHWITDLGSSENIQQNRHQKIYTRLNAREGVKKREHSYTVDRNAN